MKIDPLAIAQIGPYPVRRFIAQGGMAWVYEVQDPRFEGQEVVRALKMLKPEAAQGEEFLRFRQEAALLAGIDHPNLVTIFDFGQDEETGCFYYVMTFVDGPTMADYINEYGHLDEAAVGPLFLEMLSALGVLHARGIVHRDIKPANVLIGADNRARLSDLGIARAESSELETRTNIALGTVKFMAPEQARGQRVSAASDVFAVGLTLFHALTGEYVYDQIDGIDSSSHLDVLGYLNSLERTGESIEFDFKPALDISPAIQDVVKKAVQYKEADRYPDAQAMYEALHDALYLGGSTTDDDPVFASRWPILIGAGAVLAATLGFGIYQFVIAPRNLEADVKALAASIRPLRLDVPATLQRVREIDGVATPELVDEVETAINGAQTAWRYAQDDITAKEWSSATANLRRAQNDYDTACEVLGGAKITNRAETSVAALDQQVVGLREIYTELEAMVEPGEAIQQRWSELQAKVASLQTPSGTEGCAPVVHALDQIDGAVASRTMIASVESDLSLVAPTIAKKAEESASEAQNRAAADSVMDRAYKDEVAKGDALLADGRGLIALTPLRARDAFNEAAKAYESAAQVVPAVRARAKLRQIEQEIPKGEVDLGTAPRVITEAGAFFTNGDWAQAAQSYNEAARLIAGRLGSDRLQKEVDTLRADAREYRELALKEGADKISPTSFERAESAYDTAERAIATSDFETAAKSFEVASQTFREARSGTNAAVQSVRDTKSNLKARITALLAGRSCSEFESMSAASDCNAALSTAARGDSALDASRIEDANQFYDEATRALLRSTTEESEFLRNKPQPPVLADRFPRSKTVEVVRGTPQRLEVTATDANDGDVLSYRWRFNDELVGDVTGKTFEFTPNRPGDVAVTVTDRTGRTVDTSWTVKIKNPPPELVVTPKGAVQLARGQTQKFTAKATDPDGTPVTTEFLLNGKRVATGNAYTFKKTKPGEYNLAVVSKDRDGATARASRKIRVTNRGPELTVTPVRGVEIDVGSKQRFEAKARDPEGTEVKISFRMGGKTVGRGELYTFASQKPGKYELEIIASDVDGSTTSAKRDVVVRPGNLIPEPNEPWEGEVYDTLRQYEAALESKDISKLERVWRFKPNDPLRDIWLSRFKKYSDVSVRLEVGDTRQKGTDQAFVQFDQIESLDGRGRTWTIDAKLLKRTAGWQIISYKRSMKRTR